jgi:hypothetical protein
VLKSQLSEQGAHRPGRPPLGVGWLEAGQVWRIGLFHVGLDHVPPSLDGLRDGAGYEEGRNLVLDFRNVADEAAARAVALELN